MWGSWGISKYWHKSRLQIIKTNIGTNSNESSRKCLSFSSTNLSMINYFCKSWIFYLNETEPEFHLRKYLVCNIGCLVLQSWPCAPPLGAARPHTETCGQEHIRDEMMTVSLNCFYHLDCPQNKTSLECCHQKNMTVLLTKSQHTVKHLWSIIFARDSEPQERCAEPARCDTNLKSTPRLIRERTWGVLSRRFNAF